MKRPTFTLLLSAALSVSTMIAPMESRADNAFEKLIPRGRLLKLFKSDPVQDDSKDEQKPTDKRQRTPEPAASTASKNSRSPSSSNAPSRYRKPSSPYAAVSTRPLPPMTRTSPAAGVQAKQPAKRGLGLAVTATKDRRLIISRTAPTGNAAEAGLKPGDQLAFIGGRKLTSLAEFKQIAKTLRPGDQIAVEYIRSAQKKECVLQFGEAPEPKSQVVNSGPIGSALDPSSHNMQSVLTGPVEHVSRLNTIAKAPQTKLSNDVSRLTETIEMQRARMKAMAEELELLRKSHLPAIAPTKNNWSFPGLE